MRCVAAGQAAAGFTEDTGLWLMPAGPATSDENAWVCREWKRTSTKESPFCATCGLDLMKQTLFRCESCRCEVCSNCALYQGKSTDKAAACPLFAGKQVAGPGWCSAWAKKA